MTDARAIIFDSWFDTWSREKPRFNEVRNHIHQYLTRESDEFLLHIANIENPFPALKEYLDKVYIATCQTIDAQRLRQAVAAKMEEIAAAQRKEKEEREKQQQREILEKRKAAEQEERERHKAKAVAEWEAWQANEAELVKQERERKHREKVQRRWVLGVLSAMGLILALIIFQGYYASIHHNDDKPIPTSVSLKQAADEAVKLVEYSSSGEDSQHIIKANNRIILTKDIKVVGCQNKHSFIECIVNLKSKDKSISDNHIEDDLFIYTIDGWNTSCSGCQPKITSIRPAVLNDTLITDIPPGYSL